jgi:hypothetical protein
MKTIAMYLPQFHRVRENDEWWGEGYTEWVAVKNGKAYGPEQIQPRVPMNQNYYNLLDKGVLEWQARLIHEYGVYGLCFYHYYFADGRKILERPAENLLLWKDIDIPFCFSWANESWVRTWSKLSGNTWNSFYRSKENGDDGVLLLQNYGGRSEWKEHYDYLLPFFQDDRYIRVDRKPLFIMYYPDDFDQLSEMMDYWNELAINDGLEGIYFLATKTKHNICEGRILTEPSNSIGGRRCLFYDYEELSNKLSASAYFAEKNTFFCGFPGYDDTPRRGKNGMAVINSTPEKFYKQMKYLYYLGEIRGNEYTFVNAWNEWGEGMYLEPDEQFGFGYLKAIQTAQKDYLQLTPLEKKELFSGILGFRDSIIQKQINYASLLRRSNIFIMLKELMDTDSKELFSNCTIKRDKDRVAIYGLGLIGKVLINILSINGIDVEYAIDKKVDRYKKIKVYEPQEDLPMVDYCIVTVAERQEAQKVCSELSLLGKAKNVLLVDEFLSEIQSGEKY